MVDILIRYLNFIFSLISKQQVAHFIFYSAPQIGTSTLLLQSRH